MNVKIVKYTATELQVTKKQLLWPQAASRQVHKDPMATGTQLRTSQVRQGTGGPAKCLVVPLQDKGLLDLLSRDLKNRAIFKPA